MEGTMVGSPTTGGSVDESANRFDLIFKYIIIGDTSVGKSCILHQYLRGKCKVDCVSRAIVNANSRHTVGVEFGQRFLTVNHEGQAKTLKLQIWDTAGQERYRAVTRSYFRGSLGVIIVYDITRYTIFLKILASNLSDMHKIGLTRRDNTLGRKRP